MFEAFQQLFTERTRAEELIAEAKRVSDDWEGVVRMGIVAAQLGLTEDDLPKMAKSYFILKQTEYVSDASQMLIVLQRAVGAANRDG